MSCYTFQTMLVYCLFIASAFLLSVVLILLTVKFCKFYSLYDTVNSRKIHSGNIPRLGGVAIAVSFVVCAAVCFLVDRQISFRNIMPILTAGMLIFVFGVIDDILDLRAIWKLCVQILAVGIIVANGFRFRQIVTVRLPEPVGVVLTFCWVLGIINAYNLIDGLDGLCGTLSVTAFVTLGAIFRTHFLEGSVICFILAASVLGFLVFNWPPAKIFMGDGGSQFLGFMIAVIPLCDLSETIAPTKFPIMIVLSAFPLLDTIAAIWRRLRDRRPVMAPDRMHLHHKLLNLGYSKTHALYLVAVVQTLLCLTAYFSTYFSLRSAAVLLFAAFLFMAGFFSVIHYTHRAVLNKIRTENELRNSGTIEDL